MFRNLLKGIYNYGTLSPAKRDYYQKVIRDVEWDALRNFIPKGSSFLDVGCGAGYNLLLARELGCSVTGVDPEPYKHGVGRTSDTENHSDPLNIIKVTAEDLPFAAEMFDVVFSSHVLEHIRDKKSALDEFSRVLKNDGIIILGMPTATMAWINFGSQIIFNTHKRVVHIVRSLFRSGTHERYRLINLILPRSHSFRDKTILYDLGFYRIKNWQKIINDYFEITHVVMPALYPYPDFRQVFRLRKTRKFSSSVFFICRKRIQ